ncbi:MAG: helix-turn-helix transcriptional regulator [Solobacterium sp.]|nr:helix-turn-helix transcriptional regulator [Solobacterium sp.]
MEVKDILKSKRQETGLTQEQLSFKLGFDRSTISRIETGKVLPTDEQTTLICQYFELDPSDYLSQSTESSGANRTYFSNREIYSYIILLMCATDYLIMSKSICYEQNNLDVKYIPC